MYLEIMICFTYVLPQAKKKRCKLFTYNVLFNLKSGTTSNRKSVYMTLSLNKLYLYYDVSPLNKVFTTLHRSTQFCVLGSISACKGRYLFGIIKSPRSFFSIYIFSNATFSFS